jgi:hypothetical protein
VNEQLLITELNLIASEIKHEDDFLSGRTTWLVISQSFVFDSCYIHERKRPIEVDGGTSLTRTVLVPSHTASSVDKALVTGSTRSVNSRILTNDAGWRRWACSLHRTENPGVGGSIPSLPTILSIT